MTLPSPDQILTWLDQHNGAITALATFALALVTVFVWRANQRLVRANTKATRAAERAAKAAEDEAKASREAMELDWRPVLTFNRTRESGSPVGMLAPEVSKFGEQHDAEFVNLTGNPTGYTALMERLWRIGQTFTVIEPFIVVEQDVLPSEAQYAAMVQCPETWCAGLHHDMYGNERWSMGLMKFSAMLLADVRPMALGSHDRMWYSLDLAIYMAIGFPRTGPPHLHGPAGRHLHHEMEQGWERAQPAS